MSSNIEEAVGLSLNTPSAFVSITRVMRHSRLTGHPRVPAGADLAKFYEAAASDFPSSSLLGVGPDVPAGFDVFVTVSPRRPSATWSHGVEVRLTAAVEAGVPRCQEITVTAEEPSDSIGQDVLRSIPVAKVLRSGLLWIVSRHDRVAVERSWNSALRPQIFAPTDQNLRQAAETVKRHMRAVVAAGGAPKPNDAVAKAFYISRATAARRIRQAKDKGYLPEDLASVVQKHESEPGMPTTQKGDRR